MPQGACVIRQSARTSFSAHSGQSFYCKNGTASARCAALALSPPTQAFLFFAHSGIFSSPTQASSLRPLRHLFFAHSDIFSPATPLHHQSTLAHSRHNFLLFLSTSDFSFLFSFYSRKSLYAFRRLFFPLFFRKKKGCILQSQSAHPNTRMASN
jgi:hypothetical protein